MASGSLDFALVIEIRAGLILFYWGPPQPWPLVPFDLVMEILLQVSWGIEQDNRAGLELTEGHHGHGLWCPPGVKWEENHKGNGCWCPLTWPWSPSVSKHYSAHSPIWCAFATALKWVPLKSFNSCPGAQWWPWCPISRHSLVWSDLRCSCALTQSITCNSSIDCFCFWLVYECPSKFVFWARQQSLGSNYKCSRNIYFSEAIDTSSRARYTTYHGTVWELKLPRMTETTTSDKATNKIDL